MKIIAESSYDKLMRLRSQYEKDIQRKGKGKTLDTQRFELYSARQMEVHGVRIAQSHSIDTATASDTILKRLGDNEDTLETVRGLLADSVTANMPIVPAAEWYLDNYYLIDEQISISKKHLPKEYNRNLPHLSKGGSAGLPRVYDIALEIISHTDGRIDLANVVSFINAYQSVTPLTIGELWALPIMLRIALIENLRRLANRLAIDRIDKNLANHWADSVLQKAEKNQRDVILVIADMAKSKINLTSAFVTEFFRRLQGRGAAVAIPLTWIEQQLVDQGHTSSELLNFESQRQATDQVTMRNTIESIRILKETEWKDFVESVSTVDKILQQDINGVYGNMDFSTRDNYRHVIEHFARRSDFSEAAIAEKAINMAKNNAIKNEHPRKCHVGYFLLDKKGRAELQQEIHMRMTFNDKLKLATGRQRLIIYIGSIVLLSLFLAFCVSLFLYNRGIDTWLVLFAGIISWGAFSQFVMSVVNWLSTIIVRPSPLPKMDYSGDIPTSDSTMVVVPCMLGSTSIIDGLIEDMEVRYLGNSDDNLYYALLTDFPDAAAETMPDDEQLTAYAKQQIELLNEKYKKTSKDIFYLFHRPRKWNPREKKWMGEERKRGKLSALNNLLLDNSKTEPFSLIVGDISKLGKIKYVITLDVDTQLPRETARQFVGAMAHPLNIPVLHERWNRVVEGYGILQPRVAVSLPGENSSYYKRMHGNDSGLDPYTRVVSDVYQDLFREGSFVGKGIYDLEVFEKVLGERFPDNRILSHDLLEGNYIRSGYLTDVELYEEYPSTYAADVNRRHRWIRGDWQIAAWALPFAPNKAGKLKKTYLSSLSRWKIIDNLRRSLVPMALLLLMMLGWTLLPKKNIWPLIVIGVLFLPNITSSVWHFFHKSKEVNLKFHLYDVTRNFITGLIHFVFNFAVLPFEAFNNLDAIVKALWRMIISKRKLLEWTPSASQQFKSNGSVADAFRFMWIAPVLSIALLVYLSVYVPAALLTAIPITLLWITSPYMVWWLSKPREKKIAELSAEDTIYLRALARKTWLFFETFVTEEDNWLPPDNYQQHPKEAIAHRTSPTNIGMSLLSSLSAYDFGYITAGQLIKSTERTIETMTKMERYGGHFYNWYDTQTLEPLYPLYVSTVDSGNLSGHLLTLRQGLLDIPADKVIDNKLFNGLLDTIAVMQSELGTLEQASLNRFKADIREFYEKTPVQISEVLVALAHFEEISKEHINKFQVIQQNVGAVWMQKLEKQLQDIRAELEFYMPWIIHLPLHEKHTELAFLNEVPTFKDLATYTERAYPVLDQVIKTTADLKEKEILLEVKQKISYASRTATELITRIDKLSRQCNLFVDVEYDFLYDRDKKLLHIGYNVSEHRKDASYYDLLASEARLAIYVAIAQGRIPQQSWFALGRLLTMGDKAPVLLSWSGSMFEYLMPQLVMPTYPNTLIDQTSKAMVERQIEYGKQNGIPWGVSESGYNMVDANLNYQYKAFGVPGMGLKRGLGEDLVIAPYATMLALMVAPKESCDNLRLMSKKGFEGRYGFFEAIDYTASRLPRKQSYEIIRSFMVHHQGMGLLALAYILLDKKMQMRFREDPQFQSTILLLQERIPRVSNYYTQDTELSDLITSTPEPQMRINNTPNTIIPDIQLLSNGKYQMMLTNAGGGYSRWNNIAITRWREDTTLDNWGLFCYIKDVETGKYWSNTHQPTQVESKDYETIFSKGHVEFRRNDNGFEVKTEAVVSPEDDIEMRRVRITNRNSSKKTIEITSYAEVVLAPQAADEAHPAFSNLFVQTRIVPAKSAIMCTRRARSNNETPPWMFHQMSVSGVEIDAVSYETDRMKFIGRGYSVQKPEVLEKNVALSGMQGSVLDPIVAIRYRISLKPNQTASFDLVIGIAHTEEICEGLMSKYQDKYLKNRAFELSWTHSQVLLRQINAAEADAQLFNRIASSIIYSNPSYRADSNIIKSNNRGQSSLWGYAISGDLPIVLLKIQNNEELELTKYLIKAHMYWHLKGLSVDLVIWNEDYGSYRQELQDEIQNYIAAMSSVYINERPGRIYVRTGDQISNEDRILFQTVARVIFDGAAGSLSEQVNKKVLSKAMPAAIQPVYSVLRETLPKQKLALPDDLIFNNSVGGYTSDGKEYVILTTPEKTTPAPWSNLIANEKIGTVVTQSGSAYTWVDNAHEYRLTPWYNDPVGERAGEAFFIRDEETARFWSPMPYPKTSKYPYLTRHGFGYSVFEHVEGNIYTTMKVFVDAEESVKFFELRIKNNSGEDRKLSVTGFAQWVLGDSPHKTGMYVITEKDVNGAIFSRNKYNTTYAEKVNFFDVDGTDKSFTGDRVEFIGRNGNIERPAAMRRSKLSGRVGAAYDPCAAIQLKINIYKEEEKIIVFRLGSGNNITEAKLLCDKFKGRATCEAAFERVKDKWTDILDDIRINTPDKALNVLANGWLTYQVLASRYWGRSGFYQSGGAYGFRDQLQDVMSLMHNHKDISRGHILRAASRQFKEGDVQHWWHPPTGRGVRTTCSDDYLWLPYATARYVEITGDKDILGESVPFIEGRLLRPNEESYYDLPVFLNHYESLYKHCVYAIRYGLKFGKHGLPLIGSGDWNDGMDKVGEHGKGESVWLGFFLYDVLIKFIDIAHMNDDPEFAEECRMQAEILKDNINKHAWDGKWYRRAYFDDGTPLGSAENEECKIDSISQSWSVLSGAGLPERSAEAMEALNEHLVNREHGFIKLLTPAFDKANPNPGYIKGYLPGVRENGGQYTHAAIWSLMAFAKLKDQRAWELFSLINPVNLGKTEKKIERYKVEPYVISADIYGVAPHEGRGGWSWYTGSAAWMYQFIIESLLGLRRKAEKLYFDPCVPENWNSFRIDYKYENTLYRISVFNTNSGKPARYITDGAELQSDYITLVNDEQTHQVEVHV